jgi:hypothetical protein
MSNDNRQCLVHAVLLALSFGLLSVAAAEDARSIPVGQRRNKGEEIKGSGLIDLRDLPPFFHP